MMDLTDMNSYGDQHHRPEPRPNPCEQKGTIICVEIPPGAVIRLANLLEISSPRGISLVIRIPLFGGNCNTATMSSIVNSLRQAGASVEFKQG